MFADVFGAGVRTGSGIRTENWKMSKNNQIWE
jgi:hypothetical protein